MVRETTVSAPFQPFTFLFWEVLEPRGAGLHGQVYRVRHKHTGDHFALKVMHLADAGHASKVRRGLSTAKANYRIRHANVVAVHDLGCEEDGRVWVLMEWLQGRSVAEQLALQGGRLSVPMALHIAIETAWGVDAAHENGVIHRDIKPDNIWLSPDGQVKVLDFSLAKVIPEGITTTVQLGAVTGLGTVAYLAPEGLRTDADVDARVDGYALGLMLWQMIAGRHPYQDALRNTTELMRRQLFVDPELLSALAGLPAYVDDFMRRALAKKRDDRFSTIAEMARALMTLRDRLRADAGQGLIDLSVPYGEPPIPGTEPWARKDHAGPRPIPEQARPRPEPKERVVVGEGKPARAPRTPLGTVRMRSDQPARLAKTAPMPAQAPGCAPAATAAPVAGEQRPAVEQAGPPAPRETLPAVERAPAQRPWGALLPAVLVAVLLASAALASVGTWRWRRGSLTLPGATPPAPSATATPSLSPALPHAAPSAEAPPPTPATATELQPEPERPTANPSIVASAGSASTAPANAASSVTSARPHATARPRSPAPLPMEPPHRTIFGTEN
jgi:serine/threonine-protein kinase